MRRFRSVARRSLAGAAPLAAAGAVLALGGCHPPHPHAAAPLRAVSALDCPDTQGDLTRKSASADGKTCVYATEDGDQVTLQVVSVSSGDAHAALAPIEDQLKTEIPAAAAPPTSPPGAPDKDRVDINLPGIHIHANGDGRADVDTAGVHVAAHDRMALDRATAPSSGSNGLSAQGR